VPEVTSQQIATVVAGSAAAAGRVLGVLAPTLSAEVVLLGVDDGDRPSLAALRATRVRCVPAADPSLDAAVLGPILAALLPPTGLVLLDSDPASRDLAGWLVATLDLPVHWAVDAIRPDGDGHLEAASAILGGGHHVLHHLPLDERRVVLTKPSAAADPGPGATPPPVAVVDVLPPSGRLSVTRDEQSHADGVPLAGSRLVVSVGRGIGGPDHVDRFRELADRLGAGFGASRVAVDAGWVPFAHQVGQTGTSVAPDVYLAFGISGAIQHLAGMRGSRRVIAVNTDPQAPLCRAADLVVEGDARTVADALLARLG
jgi:electron transfer flavoprotein alpha subunit